MIFFRPKVNHPVFYGCFDWHSSVHGHWLLAALARRYPGTELADNVTAVFNEQFKVPFTIAFSHIYLHNSNTIKKLMDFMVIIIYYRKKRLLKS